MGEVANIPQLRFPEFSNEWEESKVGKVFKVSAGGDIKTENVSQIKTDGFPYPIYANAEKAKGLYGYSNLYKSEANVVTVAGRGVNIGIAHVRLEPFYPIVRLLVLNPIKDADVKFWENQLNQLNLFVESTGVPQLTAPQISSYKVKYPSKPEQQKIAAFLTAVDNKIEQLSKKQELLGEYKKGLMQQIFSQAIRFKADDGSDFPDWEEKKLGDVAEIVGGGTPPTAVEKYWNGNIQWFTPTEIKSKFIVNSKRTITQVGLDTSSAKLLPKGTLLFSSRASVGEVGIAVQECTTNQGFQSFIVNKNNEPEFLYNWIIKNKKEFIRRASGSTFLEIGKSEIKKIKLHIPALPEQTKIANFLSSIDSKIEQLSKKQELLGEYKKGLMQQIFSQVIRFKADDGCDFPDWKEKKLGDVGNFYRGHSYNSTNVKDSGLLVLRSSNIKNDSLILDNDLQFVNKDCSDNISLKTNDIVICMANGSKRLVGKSGIYHGDYNGKLTVGAFCSIFRTDNLLSKYILQTVQYRKYLHILLAGTNINNLKNSELSELTFNLPVSSFEQTKIASFLSSIDNKIEQVDKQLDESKQFKKALLQQMFV